MVLATFGVGQVLLSMIYFFFLFIWIMLLFQVSIDIFRSHDLSGAMKVVWLLFIIVLPYLGVFVYLVARGGKMHENQLKQAEAQQAAMAGYIKSAAGTPSAADELSRLHDLHTSGAIDDAEYAKLKAKVVG